VIGTYIRISTSVLSLSNSGSTMLARIYGIAVGGTNMKHQEFSHQLGELREIIAEGIAYFSAWRSLMVEDEDSAQALNRYRGLFLPARLALKSQAIMQFAKAFDNHRKTISLSN
jgi:hypothetical protein